MTDEWLPIPPPVPADMQRLPVYPARVMEAALAVVRAALKKSA